ncbi:MAG: beta-lactamase family protein [Oscillospiraceae bacterium]|nr:beta-lactamase family protein [Oscillospiraceae bacterium]
MSPADFFPEAQINDERKRDMTVEHLLTMTCGLSDSYEANDEDMAALRGDTGLAILERLPMEAAPGEAYRYSGICYQLLVGLIARATGRNVFDYAQEKLFGPLGMTSAQWERADDGQPWGSGGLSLSTHDMLRFGYLLLGEGRWEDREIIPADWIAQSRAKGKGPNGVGYMIWNDRWNPGLDCFELRGADGQFVMVFPALDMVVARTGHADRDYRGMLWFVRLWANAGNV